MILFLSTSTRKTEELDLWPKVFLRPLVYGSLDWSDCIRCCLALYLFPLSLSHKFPSPPLCPLWHFSDPSTCLLISLTKGGSALKHLRKGSVSAVAGTLRLSESGWLLQRWCGWPQSVVLLWLCGSLNFSCFEREERGECQVDTSAYLAFRSCFSPFTSAFPE